MLHLQICLFDQTSGLLFWYNVRDESSQWATEEDQAAYRDGLHALSKGVDGHLLGRYHCWYHCWCC